jgi:hypothetical protein
MAEVAVAAADDNALVEASGRMRGLLAGRPALTKGSSR